MELELQETKNHARRESHHYQTMKIQTQLRRQGSALIVTLLIAVIAGIALASCLSLVSHQNLSVARSLAWNSALPVLESGLEEALTQIHYYGCTNLSGNGWALGADGLFHKTRTVGNEGSYWQVSILPVDPPVIVSTGYVRAPLSAVARVAMILGNLQGASTPGYVSRMVRVTTRHQRSLGVGVSAKDRIEFSGGSMLDSFNSHDPNISTNGKYDPAKRRAGGKVLSNSKDKDAIHVGGTILGSAYTGPGGTVTANGGTVGDLAWAATHSGIQQGHSGDDANLEFPEVEVPFTSGYSTPGSGTFLGTNVTYLLGAGNYKMGTLTLNGGRTMVVAGDAVLFVDGNLATSGNGLIYIAPGASLKLYVSGTGSITGNGIVNDTQRPDALTIYGLASCDQFSFSGSSSFIGSVYAPDAQFSFNGAVDVSGTFTGETITITGGARIHYDEALDNASKRFVVARWDEI